MKSAEERKNILYGLDRRFQSRLPNPEHRLAYVLKNSVVIMHLHIEKTAATIEVKKHGKGFMGLYIVGTLSGGAAMGAVHGVWDTAEDAFDMAVNAVYEESEKINKCQLKLSKD